MTTETLFYDVIIVGAGVAGLSAAIRLKQQDPKITVCVLEKASQIGGHIVSGCVFEPRALHELIPEWKALQAPLHVECHKDLFWFLTSKQKYSFPIPKMLSNKGNYIVFLTELCRWLATYAESLGVEIYCGFAAVSCLFNEKEEVIGVQTNDMGLDAERNPTALYQKGIKILAKQTLLAEGCRGSLSEVLIKKFHLRQSPQTYALGLKEIWQIPKEHHQEGLVLHTLGWPLDFKTYGGGFIYHLSDCKVSLGIVIGLDYQNPYLSPFEEMQRFKTHPEIKSFLQHGYRLGYSARALNEGGLQALPNLVFPGGALIGCAAGFVNVAKIKGTHTAMKSGMLAAEGVYEKLQGRANDYEERLKRSWVYQELYNVRNIRPAFKKGLIKGMMYAALETYLFKGRTPWTFQYHLHDYETLKRKNYYQPFTYPKPDGCITFDRLSSIYLANISHRESQPCHLILKEPSLAITHNYTFYDSPETRYCPAGVYEITEKILQINSANCIHCKTCDIKDPCQNIQWTPPEGGSGPCYREM